MGEADIKGLVPNGHHQGQKRSINPCVLPATGDARLEARQGPKLTFRLCCHSVGVEKPRETGDWSLIGSRIGKLGGERWFLALCCDGNSSVGIWHELSDSARRRG